LRLKSFTGNASGLVPGGKYFYVADPGMQIFDRSTLEPVAESQLKGKDLLSVEFAPDGSRYAAITGARIFVRDILEHYDPGTQSIVRVHETRTGKTLFAFPSTTRWARVGFTSDGEGLVVTNDDDTLEIWRLPDIDG
jgi:DNA-binding beta-propeller fold protein YncE